MYMKIFFSFLTLLFVVSCATPPSSDPSKVELACAQRCSTDLATCSSGFKFFPVVVQKQCNDNYDVCIGSCPARESNSLGKQIQQNNSANKLEELSILLKRGLITQQDYDKKKAEILKNL